MNIILVSDSLAKSRIVTISQAQIMGIAASLLAAGFLLALATYYVTMNYAVNLENPYLHTLFSKLHQKEKQQAEMDMRDNLNAMAIKLGEIQARVMRLDAFGERLAKAAGIKPTEFRFSETPGQGGAIPSAELQREISAAELKAYVADLSRLLDDRSDKLGVLDSLLMEGRVAQKAIPTVLPVDQGYYSSNFGYRIDPFNGRNAFHPGVDFASPPGTAVVAAAGGVVASAELHPEYGHMVDIDHDNGLTTRYAHLSRYKVKVGDVVLKGQLVGEVGSSGRATGPHLHFEVREKGVPLNPNRYLTFNRSPQQTAVASATPAALPMAATTAAPVRQQAPSVASSSALSK